jgi:xanthine dehydrogenase accessory factor
VRKADFFDIVSALKRDGRSFAVATVVARRAPVSAHLGDRAIVHADGRMEGFVGGACSREIIRAHALESLRVRRARLISIRPDADPPSASNDDHVTVVMSCASEGAVDVYVEPIVPPRPLVVVGATPVAEALSRLARELDYDVVRVVDANEQRDIDRQTSQIGIAVAPLESLQAVLERSGAGVAVVVASQGHYDELALEAISKHGAAAYVGLVASRKRGANVRARLEAGGARHTETIHIPAGLDLGARTPPEVALSILAEIVREMPSEAVGPQGDVARVSDSAPAIETTAIDPVCGMQVAIAAAPYHAELEGTTYYFCCPHCRAHFLEDPQNYVAARS